MYCPKCKSQFREGVTRCSKCNVDLIESLPKKDEIRKDKVIKNDTNTYEGYRLSRNRGLVIASQVILGIAVFLVLFVWILNLVL